MELRLWRIELSNLNGISFLFFSFSPKQFLLLLLLLLLVNCFIDLYQNPARSFALFTYTPRSCWPAVNSKLSAMQMIRKLVGEKKKREARSLNQIPRHLDNSDKVRIWDGAKVGQLLLLSVCLTLYRQTLTTTNAYNEQCANSAEKEKLVLRCVTKSWVVSGSALGARHV